jgi:hypothetical protein
VTGSDEARGDHRAAEASLGWLGVAAADLRLLARIWATVELERALADLGVDPRRTVAALDDRFLGARVVVVPATDEEPGVAVAEPSTEGRLAATLARHGEGPAGRYVVAPVNLAAVRELAAAAGVAISRPAVGPFGRSVLLLDGPATGPHVILVAPAAVPSRP